MAKLELTDDQKNFKLDDYTLNRQFTYWLTKSKCMWNLKTTHQEYDKLREYLDHAIAFEKLKVMMFNLGVK